jgi:hypothetical protein
VHAFEQHWELEELQMMRHMHINTTDKMRPFQDDDLDRLFAPSRVASILETGLILFNPGLGFIGEYLDDLLAKCLLPDDKPAFGEDGQFVYNGCLHRTIMIGSNLHAALNLPNLSRPIRAICKFL